MNGGITEGDVVEIFASTGKDFDKDRVGVVTNVDGAYILVKRNISGVEVEVYPNELKTMRKLYKIVVDPSTFDCIVRENYLTEKGYLMKRNLDPSEVSEWTEEDFRAKLGLSGYGEIPCDSYIAQQKIIFKED